MSIDTRFKFHFINEVEDYRLLKLIVSFLPLTRIMKCQSVRACKQSESKSALMDSAKSRDKIKFIQQLRWNNYSLFFSLTRCSTSDDFSRNQRDRDLLIGLLTNIWNSAFCKIAELLLWFLELSAAWFQKLIEK
jgi:hypothetical protein